MTGNNPLMKFPFIVHGKFMHLLITHNRQTKFTKVQLGKHCATVRNKKLNQDGVWPIVLVCNDLQLKIAVVYEVKSNLFVISVNDQPYLRLPYVSPNQNYGDAEEELFTATIAVNDKVAIEETMHWNFFSVSEQIEEALGEEKMSTFSVKNLMCKSYITNEVLDIIANQIISEEEGLASVVLHDFEEKSGPFDESLLERLAQSCT